MREYHVRICEGLRGKFPGSTRLIIHCESEQEANDVLDMVKKRLSDCQLSLNENKTKLVYCKDYRRKKKNYKVKFDFLGYSF